MGWFQKFILLHSENRKQLNKKTTLLQYLCVFNVVTKQIVLLDTYQTTN